MIALGEEGDPNGIKRSLGLHTKQQRLELPDGAGEGISQRNQPFFVRYMISQILNNANGSFDSLGKSEKARQRTLFEGGLKIITTLEPEVAELRATGRGPAVRGVHAEPRQRPSRYVDRVGRHEQRRDPHDALGQELP